MLIGLSDADWFVVFSMSEVNESALDGYMAGLFKVWVKGSSFLRSRSVTAETGGTVCGFELNEKLCFEIDGKGAQWPDKTVSRIYLHSSK